MSVRNWSPWSPWMSMTINASQYQKPNKFVTCAACIWSRYQSRDLTKLSFSLCKIFNACSAALRLRVAVSKPLVASLQVVSSVTHVLRNRVASSLLRLTSNFRSVSSLCRRKISSCAWRSLDLQSVQQKNNNKTSPVSYNFEQKFSSLFICVPLQLFAHPSAVNFLNRHTLHILKILNL